MSLKQRIETAIREFKAPGTDKDLIAAGQVQDVVLSGDKLVVSLVIEPAHAQLMESVRKAIEARLSQIDGLQTVQVVMTAEQTPHAHSHDHSHAAKGAPPPKPAPLAGVRHLVLVASGKGGVGKSTTSVNLAMAFSQLGFKTGFVDCDIYGPSASTLLGQAGQQPKFDDQDKIIPMESLGLLSISMSNIVPPDAAAIWRGPMVIQSVQQFLQGVRWDIHGPLDILVADLPPGTGDIPMTIAQTANVSGAVLVSTPQDLALIDARKAYDMFRKMDVPVLGLVENMSFFLCPHCGERSDVFGHGGARDTATKLGLPFLGEVPLHMAIRASSDGGLPIAKASPDSKMAAPYFDIAHAVLDKIGLAAESRKQPG